MDHIFKCPHCDMDFIVNRNDFNCMILRHGSYKGTMLNINPHLNKEECDRLFQNNEIYGCGKPLQIVENNGTFDVIICSYI